MWSFQVNFCIGIPHIIVYDNVISYHITQWFQLVDILVKRLGKNSMIAFAETKQIPRNVKKKIIFTLKYAAIHTQIYRHTQHSVR